jgi:hypothetical protein
MFQKILNTLHGHLILLHASILQEEDHPYEGSVKGTSFTASKDRIIAGKWSITVEERSITLGNR